MRRVLRHHACEEVRLIGFFQITDVFRAQLKGYSVDRAVNMMLLRGADHRGGDFYQQPGQLNFGHRDLMPFGKFGDAGNNEPVLLCRAVVFAPGIIIFHRSPRVAF